jgi:hypothetical protein
MLGMNGGDCRGRLLPQAGETGSGLHEACEKRDAHAMRLSQAEPRPAPRTA